MSKTLKLFTAAITCALLLVALPACDTPNTPNATPSSVITQAPATSAIPTSTPTATPTPTSTPASTPTPTASPTPEPAPTASPMPKLQGTTGNYLILCETEAQKQSIAAFVAYKEWCGYSVTLKSMEADVKPDPNADASVAIQQYLAQMEKDLSLQYVLLVGDPFGQSICPQHTGGIIPMRYLYHMPSYHDANFSVPSDLYYALDFNWDSDKDGFAGESDEVRKTSRNAKPKLSFMLGRIPFSDAADIERVLDTTIRYEQSRKKGSTALVASTIFGYPESKQFPQIADWAYYGDALGKHLAATGVNATTLFEKDGIKPSKYECTYPLSNENLAGEMRKSYDFVYTVGVVRSVWTSDGNANGICDNEVVLQNYLSKPEDGYITGFYFMDGLNTLMSSAADYPPHIQDFLAKGSVCAAIATTGDIGFNPRKPEPKLASLLFTHQSPVVSYEFYQSVMTLIAKGDLYGAYVYCYVGDPSWQLLG